jgi:Rod binding domain-containing protein
VRLDAALVPLSLVAPFSPGNPAAPAPLAESLAASTDSSRDRGKIGQSARQFEAQLLTSVLASLEKSFGSVPGSDDSGVGAQYRSLATQSLASAWAEAGGVGIARILTNALLKTSLPKTSREDGSPSNSSESKASQTAVPRAMLPTDRMRVLQGLPHQVDLGTE